MRIASLFLALLLATTNSYADGYTEAKKAALTALYIQSGGKAFVTEAQGKLRTKLEKAGFGVALTIGGYGYAAFIEKRIKFKTGGFTFQGSNSSLEASYSVSF